MSYKMIESKGKGGIKVCQHYEPQETDKAPSCTNCQKIDGEIQALHGIVTAVSCKLRNNRTPEQIEALKVARVVPDKKIKKIGHHVNKTDDQADLLNPDRLSAEELKKRNLNLFD